MAPGHGDYRRTIQNLERELRDLKGYASDTEEEEIEEQPVQQDFKTAIVVDNLPVVGDDRYEKLLGVLRKMFSQFGAISNIDMPKKNGKTVGFAFIDYDDEEIAKKARDGTDNVRLDKNHVFKVCMYEDLDKYSNVPEKYQAPPKKTFTQRYIILTATAAALSFLLLGSTISRPKIAIFSETALTFR